jgi:hypothetical protein
MSQIAFLLAGLALVAGVVVLQPGRADEQSGPACVTTIPPGYRDWRLISVAHEEGTSTVLAPFWATIWRSRPAAILPSVPLGEPSARPYPLRTINSRSPMNSHREKRLLKLAAELTALPF